MANIKENTTNPVWPEGIYQLETSDPVLGGENGVDNRQAEQLAARTQVLKKQIADNKTGADTQIAAKAEKTTVITAGNGLTGGGDLSASRTLALGTPGTLSGATTNSATATSHTHAIAAATATVAGVTKVINALTSTDAASALSAAQGKALHDDKADKATTLAGYGITDGVTQAQLTAAINNVIAGAPGALDTLKELSTALGNDANFAATVTNQLAQKADKAATLAGYGITDFVVRSLEGEGLNNPILTAGIYAQAYSNKATVVGNYPIEQAGTLLVLPTANGTQQFYYPFAVPRIYWRGKTNSTTWGAWQLIADGAQSIAAQGWTKIGSLILQWGSKIVANNSTADVILPIAFPNTVLVALAGGGKNTISSTSSQQAEMRIFNRTKSSFTIANDDEQQSVDWIALGY